MADDTQEIPNRDEELLRQARGAPDGDLRAFEQLVLLYQKRILADCRHMTRDESVSEDLAQEVFVKAFFGLRSFEGRSSFRHWLQRIKVHHCLNHLKKKEGKLGIAIDDEVVAEHGALQVEPVVQKKLETDVENERIKRILDSMSQTLRIPLVMRDMDELPYEEIAKALGIGLSAVKMRIKRGREEFRRRYHNPQEDPAHEPTM